MLPVAPASPTLRPQSLLRPALVVIIAVVSLLAMTSRSEAAPSGAEAFGISTGGSIQSEDPATLGKDLDAIGNLGAKWIRVDINWAQIQAAGPSSYDWTAIDRVVDGATARGVNVLGGIVYTPGWARPSGTSSTYGPEPAQYAAFAKAAAAHLSARGVHAYEVWNEPNVKAFWTPSPNVAHYTRLLKAAYPAIKAGDPQATVLSGGTAPAPDDGTSYSPISFLKGIYANGGGGSFDAVSHHPYCWPAMPGDAEGWSAWYQMYGTSPSLRSVRSANGDSGKKIWATEFGAPTNGPAGSFVSEGEQAKMIAKAYSVWRGYDWAGPLFSYQARDYGTKTDTRENFFGLLHHDFTPKPAYDAYRQAVAEATGTPPPPPTTPPTTTETTTTTTTTVTVKKGKGNGGAKSLRRSAVTGSVRAHSGASTKIAGRVKLKIFRRADGSWRMASRQKVTKVGPQGRFRTRLGRFGRHVRRPGTYRIRARYTGASAMKPSASRYRKFKVRSA
jgi:hypothetical protein